MAYFNFHVSATFAQCNKQHIYTRLVTFAIVATVCVSSVAGMPLWAAPGDTNSLNTSSSVAGGTYYNTSGNHTTFQNASGLTVGSGTTVRGLEVDAAGNVTNNGGHLHFDAGNGIVRVDGNINVNALSNGNAFTGNGGMVTVNAGMFYQNGTITANGLNGGLMQFNVGSALFTGNSVTEAIGTQGKGGVITMQASDLVNIAAGGRMTTSGQNGGADYKSNLISIEGGIVNNDGIIEANGLTVQNVPGDGGLIRLVARGGATETTVENLLENSSQFTSEEKVSINSFHSTMVERFNGSISNGTGISNVTLPEFPPIAPRGLYALGDRGRSSDDANPPTRGGSGGTIILSAVGDIYNSTGRAFDPFAEIVATGGQGGDGNGNLPSDAGNGGTLSMVALGSIYNGGIISLYGGEGGDQNNLFSELNTDANGSFIESPHANEQMTQNSTELDVSTLANTTGGHGGHGGFAGFAYQGEMVNNGVIDASGGEGEDGADALAVDYHAETMWGSSAFAKAVATGGNGGNGGNGGVIVFSSYADPTGTGAVFALGGDGGDGGDATARAAAVALSIEGWDELGEQERDETTLNADAIAIANGGTGGNAGMGGVIMNRSGNNFSGITYNNVNGRLGERGVAHAEAVSLAVKDAYASTTSIGDVGGTQEAIGVTLEVKNGSINDLSLVLGALQDANTIFNFDLTPGQIKNAISGNSAISPGDIQWQSITNTIPGSDAGSPTAGPSDGGAIILDNTYTQIPQPGPTGSNTILAVPETLLLTHKNNRILFNIDTAVKSLQQMNANAVELSRNVEAGSNYVAFHMADSSAFLIVDDPAINGTYNTVNILSGTGGSTATTANALNNQRPPDFNYIGITTGENSEQFSSNRFWINPTVISNTDGPVTPSNTGDSNTVFDTATTATTTGNNTNTNGNGRYFGLFQDNGQTQPQLKQTFSLNSDAIVIAFRDPSFFLMEEYSPLTQEVLKLAEHEYKMYLREGYTEAQALTFTVEYLERSNIDVMTAEAILDSIQRGEFSANEPVKSALQAIVNRQDTVSLPFKASAS